MNCALCRTAECQPAGIVGQRHLFSCPSCGLVSIPSGYHLSVENERARYDLHDNSADNDGYVRFLSQVAEVVEKNAGSGVRVLDFGCGRNAVLTGILEARGIQCDAYDPLYDHPLPVPFPAATYGAVILCEVIEHCRDLQAVFGLAGTLCTRDASIVVRTRCYPEEVDWSRWWYAQDTTHINFFSTASLACAAGILKRKLYKTEYSDVFVFR